MITLFSTDLEKIVFLFQVLSKSISGIFLAIISICLVFTLYNYYAGLVYLSTTCLFISLQKYFAGKQGSLRPKIAKKTEKRVLLMNEILTGISIIKMLVWEKYFTKLINNSRKRELGKLIQSFTCRISYRIISFSSLKFVIVSIIVVCKYTNSFSFTLRNVIQLISIIMAIEGETMYNLIEILFRYRDCSESMKRVLVSFLKYIKCIFSFFFVL